MTKGHGIYFFAALVVLALVALAPAVLAMRKAAAEEASATDTGRFRLFQGECEIYNFATDNRRAEPTLRTRPTVFKIDTATGQAWIYDEELRPDGTRKLQWIQVPWQGVRNPFGK